MGTPQRADLADADVPLLLAGILRSMIEALHVALRDNGHPHARPSHGFALQAVGDDGPTVSEIAQRLTVSKQAAAKTVKALEALGYAYRVSESSDHRVARIYRSDSGVALLTASASFFAEYLEQWRDSLGTQRAAALIRDLRQLGGDRSFTALPALLAE